MSMELKRIEPGSSLSTSTPGSSPRPRHRQAVEAAAAPSGGTRSAALLCDSDDLELETRGRDVGQLQRTHPSSLRTNTLLGHPDRNSGSAGGRHHRSACPQMRLVQSLAAHEAHRANVRTTLQDELQALKSLTASLR